MIFCRRKVLPTLLMALLVLNCCSSPACCVRIHGIPGTIIGRTLLQVNPGWDVTAITTLASSTDVQVLCKREDVIVIDDPWWLKVHVWSTGMEGWVSDYFVLCRHTTGFCRVPFCT